MSTPYRRALGLDRAEVATAPVGAGVVARAPVGIYGFAAPHSVIWHAERRSLSLHARLGSTRTSSGPRDPRNAVHGKTVPMLQMREAILAGVS